MYSQYCEEVSTINIYKYLATLLDPIYQYSVHSTVGSKPNVKGTPPSPEKLRAFCVPDSIQPPSGMIKIIFIQVHTSDNNIQLRANSALKHYCTSRMRNTQKIVTMPFRWSRNIGNLPGSQLCSTK